MLTDVVVPIVIVGFGNAGDIVKCLTAIEAQRGCPKFGVFICENKGSDAYKSLVQALCAPGGPCVGAGEELNLTNDVFVRASQLRLVNAAAPVFVAQAKENLGFPGGINVWVRLFLREPGWEGVWVLNPDTWPQADALAELVDYAKRRGKGMVASRIMFPDRSDIGSSRGLKWHKLRAKTVGVDIFAPVNPVPDPDDVERRIDSPTAVSLYVTSKCIREIGLMDESYFLYYEDFDWGILAKAACGVGYAHASVVPHIGGSSTGAARNRTKRSKLAVYLENRNKIRFVRRHFPGWLPWTVFVSFLRTGEFLLVGSTDNCITALRGLMAGLRGETGRPDMMTK